MHRCLAFASALLLIAPACARAIVSDVQPIDGPGADVIDVADAAMSEDGTGGIVWLKEVDGHPHVFAAQFRNGAWGPARRVDVGQGFESSWPRIGAGDGGRLVVTWVQEFGIESDRLFSATLDPGASDFQPPVPIDFNVGEATSTFPDLAMARGGQAYLAYRVVTDISPANPPGYVGADVRVARYNGRLWSVLGTPIDRNINAPVRLPTEENSPKVGIDVQGGGVVAWQEPDDEFVDRVWARRLFGASVGIPLQVSPSSWEGAPLRGPADAFCARRRRLRPGGGRLPPAARTGEQARRAAGDGQRDARRLLRALRQLRPGAAHRRRRARRSGSAQRRGRSPRPLPQRLLLRSGDAARLRRRRRGGAGQTARRGRERGRRRPAGRPGRNRCRGCRLARAARRDRLGRGPGAARRRRGRADRAERPERRRRRRLRPGRLRPGRRDRRLGAGQRRQRTDRRRRGRRSARSVPRPAAGSVAAQEAGSASPGTARSTRSAGPLLGQRRRRAGGREPQTPQCLPHRGRHRRRAPPDPDLRRRRRRPGNRQQAGSACASTVTARG